MNQVTLVLSQPDALINPGDDVHGDIWLEIYKPTSGRTLKLKIEAFERCILRGGQSFTEPLITDSSNTNFLVWEARAAVFPFGSFRKSFSVKVPANLPGTFCCTTLKDHFEQISIEYKITAYIEEASDLSDSEVIRVVVPETLLDSSLSNRLSKFGRKSEVRTHEIKPRFASDVELKLEFGINDPRPYTFSDDLVVDVQINYRYINNLLAKSFKLTARTVTLVRTLQLQGDCVMTQSIADFSSKPPANEYPPKTIISKDFDCDCGVITLPLRSIPKEHWTEASIDKGYSIRCHYEINIQVKDEDGKVYEAEPLRIWLYPSEFPNAAKEPKLHGIKAQLYEQAIIIDNLEVIDGS